jgi:hypothetical protein
MWSEAVIVGLAWVGLIGCGYATAKFIQTEKQLYTAFGDGLEQFFTLSEMAAKDEYKADVQKIVDSGRPVYRMTLHQYHQHAVESSLIIMGVLTIGTIVLTLTLLN